MTTRSPGATAWCLPWAVVRQWSGDFRGPCLLVRPSGRQTISHIALRPTAPQPCLTCTDTTNTAKNEDGTACCAKCASGRGVLSHCAVSDSGFQDTVCEDCAAGETFSVVTNARDACQVLHHQALRVPTRVELRSTSTLVLLTSHPTDPPTTCRCYQACTECEEGMTISDECTPSTDAVCLALAKVYGQLELPAGSSVEEIEAALAQFLGLSTGDDVGNLDGFTGIPVLRAFCSFGAVRPPRLPSRTTNARSLRTTTHVVHRPEYLDVAFARFAPAALFASQAGLSL